MIWPTPLAPGTKRWLPCASLGTWGPPTGLYGVLADSLGLPDAEYLIDWDLAPTPPAPGTKRGRPCTSWSPWGPATGLCGVSADSLGLPGAEYLIERDLTPTPPALGTKRGRPCASWAPWELPTYRVIWGISSFVVAPSCKISYQPLALLLKRS